jgi:hypothetical protein
MITLEHGDGNKKFTLITLVNWDLYQSEQGREELPSGDEGNAEEPDNNQTPDINNKYNNDNNEKETKEDKKEDKYSADFETFWCSYPRRIEKKRAFRMWKARIREKNKGEDMISAALNYGKYCRDSSLEDRYIKHPATFLGKDKPLKNMYLEYLKSLKRRERQGMFLML